MKHRNYCIAILFLTVITHGAWCQVIPSFRSTDWTKAGYRGAIPVYPVVKNITDYGGSGDGFTLNDAALQNAITSLNNQNGIIYFPAGNYVFNAAINLGDSIVLKGEGATNTILRFNLSGSGNLISIAGAGSSTVANVSSPAFKESSSVVVDDASLFGVNDHIKIYQNDAALVNDIWALESVGQVVRIDSITGNRIYFSNALRRNYLLADAPKIRRLEMSTGVGIECLTIKRLDSSAQQTANIFLSYAANCWVTGIESDSCNFAHIQIGNSTNIEISDSYFHGSFGYGGGGQGYGVACEYTSGDCLIENNIFKHLRHSMLVQSGANGNVFDYNYSLEPFKTDTIPYDFSGDIVIHGNYPYLNLFEGNIVQNIVIDASHGINGPYNTLFRNRAASYGIFISPGAGDSSNIVGNEITGTGFYKGNYYLQGNGNLEYGNNKNDSIIPAGSTVLTEKSYIYNTMPAFWNIPSLWPSVGIPIIVSTGTNPAKERFAGGMNISFCIPPVPVIYAFTGNGNWTAAANWSNDLQPPAVLSAGSEIIIDPPGNTQCVLNIPYTVTRNATLTVKPGKRFIVQQNLTILK